MNHSLLVCYIDLLIHSFTILYRGSEQSDVKQKPQTHLDFMGLQMACSTLITFNQIVTAAEEPQSIPGVTESFILTVDMSTPTDCGHANTLVETNPQHVQFPL